MIDIDTDGKACAALKSDGTLWMWGCNGSGQLGLGEDSSGDHFIPEQVPGLSDIKQVCCGDNFTCALKTDGTVFSWGGNANGPLGHYDSWKFIKTPTKVEGIDNVKEIEASHSNIFVLKNDNSLWSWGSGTFGIIGNGEKTSHLEPVRVANSDDIVQMSMNNFNGAILKSDGTLWTWGENDYGQLGLGTSGNGSEKSVPTKVESSKNIIQVEVGYSNILTITSDGSLWNIGGNYAKQIGSDKYEGQKEIKQPIKIFSFNDSEDPEPEPEPEPSGNYDLNSLSYKFSNSTSGFGYSSSYRIPLNIYQLMFNDTEAKIRYKEDGFWGGNCFGMSSTTGMFNSSGSGVSLKSYNSSAGRVLDLGNKDFNSSLNLNITQFIEAMQVSQPYDSIQNCYRNNRNLNELCKAVSSGNPTIIAIFGNEGGHALVAYKLEKRSDSESYLYIYDCNYPQKERHITLKTDSSGNYTGWYYKLNDRYDWGSDYSGSWISYVPYSVYQSVWSNRQKEKLTNTNTLITNSENFEVKDYDGNAVASVQDGKLSTTDNSISQIWTAGITADDKGSSRVQLKLPTDVYEINNKDEKVDSLEVGMLNVEQGLTLSTTGDNVTLAVNDNDKVNTATFDLEANESYSVELDSTLPSASGKENVKISGVGTGGQVTVGLSNGNYVLDNAENAKIIANGKEINPSDDNADAETIEIYRLYNESSKEHLYTSDLNEYNTLPNYGWKKEGVGWNAPATGDPVYRLYSPVTGAHLYTRDENEVNTLLATGAWTADNDRRPIMYSGGSKNVYRLYNEGIRMHLLTTDENEYNTLGANGWNKEGIALNALN